MEVPEVKYARSGDVHIAYQVFGEGPDLVVTPSGWNHALLRWELPAYARLMRRLASFARVVVWDKRGTGMSDRHGSVPTLDAQKDDLQSVIDATGCERPALFGLADGAALNVFFAASSPQRVSSLILYGALPRFAPGGDGLGVTEKFLRAIREGAEPDRMLRILSPSCADDPVLREWWRRNATMSASPGTVAQFVSIWMAVDLLPILPTVAVPTTVIQPSRDGVGGVANGRESARLVPGARYVEIDAEYGTWTADAEALAGIVEEAVTGERHARVPDRMLASILFTDIVASTDTAARLGDAEWSEVLDDHDAFVGRRVAALGGRVVKSLGDGALAVFDSPARALRCGAELVEGLAARGIGCRAGIHTGECEKRGEDIGGIAVHIAARVGALARPGEVLVTGTVRDLVFGSDLVFEDRGPHELRGVPGSWPLLALAS